MSLRAGEMGIRLFTALLALAVVGSSPAHAQRVTGSDLRDQVAPDCKSLHTLVGIGSSTVFPLAELKSRLYNDEAVYPVVRSTGSTPGKRDVLVKSISIGHASSPMGAEDYKNADCDCTREDDPDTACATAAEEQDNGVLRGECNGVRPKATIIATDKLAVITPDDASNFELSLTQLAEAITYPQEVEQRSTDDDNTYTLFLPDTNSGTYDYVTERLAEVMEGFAVPEFSNNYIFTYPNDNNLVSDLTSSKGQSSDRRIGVVGAAYLSSNSEGIKGVSLREGDSGEYVAPIGGSGDYPLARPLYMYHDSAEDDAEDSEVRFNNEVTRKYICSVLEENAKSADESVVTAVGYTRRDTGNETRYQTDREFLRCNDLNNQTLTAGFKGGAEQQLFCHDSKEVLALGSSTVFPVAQGAESCNPDPFSLIIGRSGGTGVGFDNFLNGGSEVSDASRAITASDVNVNCDEINGSAAVATGLTEYDGANADTADPQAPRKLTQTCNGRLPVGVPVATDALAFAKNPSQSNLNNLSVDQLATLFSTGSLGGTDYRILRPDSNSGTYDFVKEFFTKNAESVSGDFEFADNSEPFPNDDNQAAEIADDSTAVGIFGAAYLSSGANAGSITPINVDGANPVDDPTSYPVKRPLFMYYDGRNYNPRVRDFICSILTYGQTIVEKVGYIPLEKNFRDFINSELSLTCKGIKEISEYK